MLASKNTVVILATALFMVSCAKYQITGGGKATRQTIDDNSKKVADIGGRERQDGITGLWEQNDGSMVLSATPNRTTTGAQIRFTARCFDNNNVQVNWDMGDGTKMTGLDFNYAYRTAGTFIVRAICTPPNGEGRSGQLTIVITAGVPIQFGSQNGSQNGGGAYPY